MPIMGVDFDLLKSFDIDLLLDVGFDSGDLSMVFDDNLDVEDDHFDEEKELEAAKTTDIKLGDYFALGRHRFSVAMRSTPTQSRC